MKNNLNHPLISILIPVYNSEEFIEKAVNSAINQTYKNIEIIIVDNQSTDGTWEILQAYQKKDDRIKLFRNSANIGPVKNWKICLDKASGEYAKFLWSDDYIADSFIEDTLPYLKNKNIGFVFTKTTQFHENSKEIIELYNLGRSGIFDNKIFINGLLIDGTCPTSPGCGLFRLTDLKKNLMLQVPNKIGSDFSQHAIGNDSLLYLLTAKDYSKFAYVNKTLSFFRAHDASITTSSESYKLDLLYSIARAYYIENYEKDNKIIKKFNTQLCILLIKYRGNTLGIKSMSDFYLNKKDYPKDYFYLFQRVFRKIKRL